MRKYDIVVGVIFQDQSNGQGAAQAHNGGGVGNVVKMVSRYNGMSEPTFPNGNGGGSCYPRLFDLGIEDGIYYKIFNIGVGSASIFHWTGRVNCTVTGGDAATPLAGFNMTGRGITAGTGVVAKEGDTGFDPLGFLAFSRAQKAAWPQIPFWVSCYSNAESDGGASAADYQAAQESIANYNLASGVNLHLAGLSSSGGNSSGNMLTLQGAYRAAITKLKSEGKPAFQGGDLFDECGMNPKLYEERFALGTKVHLYVEGQQDRARVWHKAIKTALGR